MAQNPNPSPIQTATNQTQSSILELGKTLERDIAGGQRHSYAVALTDGQFMRIEIKAEGIDLGVLMHLPDGRTRQLYQPFGGIRNMVVGEVAESSGSYRLDVYPASKAAPGHYQICLVAVHAATEKEKALQEARDLFTRAFGLHKQARNSEALPLMARSVEIREKQLGANDLLVAITIGSLGSIYEDLGDYATAEALFLTELNIKEKILGLEDPQVADALVQIGSFYKNKGDYVQAEEIQQKVLSIYHKQQLDDSPYAAAALDALGDINYERGDYVNAAKYYEQSRVLWEKQLGPNHFHMAPSYTHLGRVAYDAGDYLKAEAMFQRALSLTEKSLGPDHPKITEYLNDLAMLYCTTGDYAKGEDLYLRGISIHEQTSSMGQLSAREALYGIARCYAGQGRSTEAVKYQSRAGEIEEHYLALNLAIGSEREKLAMLDNVAAHLSRIISLHTTFARADPAARDLAALSILQRKGRIQDAMSASLAALRQRFSPEDQKLLDKFNESTRNLAQLELDGPQKATAAAYQKQVKELEEEKENLEAEISRRSSGSFARSTPVTLAAVQAAIPADAALIEFSVYEPFDPKAADNSKAYGAPHYVAYTLQHQGEVQWKDLGEAGAIDNAVTALRRALRNPESSDVKQLARVVDEKVMQPLQGAIGDTKLLLISADGELNLVPVGALVDEEGRYLIQRYAITYLTSGRDLLRLQVGRQGKNPPVVVADPDFGEPSLVADREESHRINGMKNGSARIDYSQIFFGPLPGANEEIHALRDLLPNANFLLRDQATKGALEKIVAPSILHIATHGFFLSDRAEDTGPERSSSDKTRGLHAKGKIENPLLRSGLALAGANRHGENGILTALETSGLNLWGTKLVVLSACDSGLGEIRTGEGVFGLRRALVLAGSESQMMSLWRVSDRSTRDLMIGFYQRLVKGVGRGDALRQAQLQMLRDKSHGHPYYWASFIQSGEWANLEGKR